MEYQMIWFQLRNENIECIQNRFGFLIHFFPSVSLFLLCVLVRSRLFFLFHLFAALLDYSVQFALQLLQRDTRRRKILAASFFVMLVYSLYWEM